ncbi:MarR family winged helix-turn-helix transcriptional regulator [Novosphingobium humi]|uniref:MarR family winged helix-turn-helix transcriptional regulator n=1 Tax=Novosphingobium humi TaxID=2282397 RepID=A0ABY7U2T9_9SPHN|nr:MarR family winged helix-turn-helix transcriptional regulator [Novosphingobium humi]WCT79818.1 MarR family winged helix-turn-helix transcriptional regulator [Novosphingobium humi]WJT01015.1 MarR family winged helix-turn-helix transcriptional regulator [Novosphingobium humi]
MTLPRTWDLFGGSHLPHRLLLLARMMDRATMQQLQEHFGLTLAEWRVLAFICSVGPASAADIGGAFEADRAEVSRAVKRLIDAGMIERKNNEQNRKRQIISALPAGQAVFDRARKMRSDYFEFILQDIDQPARDLLNDALRKIAMRVRDPKS